MYIRMWLTNDTLADSNASFIGIIVSIFTCICLSCDFYMHEITPAFPKLVSRGYETKGDIYVSGLLYVYQI